MLTYISHDLYPIEYQFIRATCSQQIIHQVPQPSHQQLTSLTRLILNTQHLRHVCSAAQKHPRLHKRLSPAFEVKGLLYKDQGARPHIWTDDLLNPLTEIYQNLSQSFCRLVLDSLRLGNPDIAKDAKCHKVVFSPVTLFYYQKRQVDATGNSSENSTQGVQASSEIQLVSPNATELNQTEFNNILVTGYSQVNSSSEMHLSNVETNVVIPDSTTMVQLTQTSIQTQFEEFTTNQHVISTESQISTELYKFSSLAPAFEVKGLLYKDQGARPHIWTDDLLNPLTEIYQNLSQSFCRLVLDSLRLGNPDIAKDAKCHKVVFSPVTLFYYQKRQVDATGNSSENSTQGVQASSEIQLVSPNATELNQTEFNNILVTGYSQVNSSSEMHLSNVETNVVIPDSTTMVQLTQTSIQTQFEEFTTNQHVISTESQISTELYKFSSLAPAFEVKGLLYKDQGARPHIWTDDLLNPLTEIYQNLSQSFCRLVLDSLRLGNPDIAKDAKCHKVVFSPVTLFYYQKRQVDATGNSSENSTQGVQASSEIQLVSPNATELNQTEFNNILVTGYSQVNSSSEMHLSNVETNGKSSDLIVLSSHFCISCPVSFVNKRREGNIRTHDKLICEHRVS
ncbi:unnamed protein product [Schistosoma haematobium]|nr:unnamed protein product [Schistosoma haematobium]